MSYDEAISKMASFNRSSSYNDSYMATIKPIDRDIIIKAATETGAIVTAEEHNIIGGLGSAVSAAGLRCDVPLLLGVTLFSALFVLVFQGGLVALSMALGSFLNDFAVAELICAGSVMIIALGLNLIGLTKIKVANYFPALVFAPAICALFAFLGQYIPALA